MKAHSLILNAVHSGFGHESKIQTESSLKVGSKSIVGRVVL